MTLPGLNFSTLTFLKSVPLLQSFSENQFLRLSTTLRLVRFAPGEVIYRQGDRGSSFYIVDMGVVRVHVREDSPDAPPVADDGDAAVVVQSPLSAVGSPAGGGGSTRWFAPGGPGRPGGPRARVLSRTRDASFDAAFSGGSAGRGGRQSSSGAGGSGEGGGGGGDDDATVMSGSSNGEPDAALLGPVTAEYTRGFFFGERALLTAEPRATSCVAGDSEVVCYELTRAAFEEVR